MMSLIMTMHQESKECATPAHNVDQEEVWLLEGVQEALVCVVSLQVIAILKHPRMEL